MHDTIQCKCNKSNEPVQRAPNVHWASSSARACKISLALRAVNLHGLSQYPPLMYFWALDTGLRVIERMVVAGRGTEIERMKTALMAERRVETTKTV